MYLRLTEITVDFVGRSGVLWNRKVLITRKSTSVLRRYVMLRRSGERRASLPRRPRAGIWK